MLPEFLPDIFGVYYFLVVFVITYGTINKQFNGVNRRLIKLGKNIFLSPAPSTKTLTVCKGFFMPKNSWIARYY